MPKKDGETWVKDWKNVIAVLAIAASAWASVRGEMAKNDADSANSNAKSAKIDAKSAEKEADNNATAVLAVLNQRIQTLEASEHELRAYIVSMDQRDKYWEKVLWEVYRTNRGVRVADRVVAGAPKKPSPPKPTAHKPMAVPRDADAAKEQYIKACETGDPLCAVPLSK